MPPRPRLIGLPYDASSSFLRGAAAAPAFIRKAVHVYVIDELDGISTLIARMPTLHAHAVMSVIDATAAASDRADGRLIGERRSDALVSLVLGHQPYQRANHWPALASSLEKHPVVKAGGHQHERQRSHQAGQNQLAAV